MSQLDKPDFPFYNGQPQSLTVRQWRLLLALCVLGFVILSLPLPLFLTPWGQFIPACLFVGLPLLGLMAIAPRGLSALFRPLNLTAWLLMPAFAFLNLAASVLVALLVASFFTVSVNPAVELIANFSGTEMLLFMLRTLPQLVGEEVITILPMLALLTWLVRGRGWSRRKALLAAWLLTALLFGVLHIPTYDWNVAQSILIIGTARLVLSLAYLVTANLWVSAGAHILSDWMIFIAALLAMEAELV